MRMSHKDPRMQYPRAEVSAQCMYYHCVADVQIVQQPIMIIRYVYMLIHASMLETRVVPLMALALSSGSAHAMYNCNA